VAIDQASVDMVNRQKALEARPSLPTKTLEKTSSGSLPKGGLGIQLVHGEKIGLVRASMSW